MSGFTSSSSNQAVLKAILRKLRDIEQQNKTAEQTRKNSLDELEQLNR